MSGLSRIGVAIDSELLGKFDLDQGVRDLAAAADWLRARRIGSGKVGVVGFCIGGRVAALMGARSKPDAVCSFYGVRLDQHLPEMSAIGTPAQFHNDILSGSRVIATLFSIFGVVAFILSGVGLYGVMAFTVARRTRELGIRMALGAQRGSVVRLVMQEVFFSQESGLLLPCRSRFGSGVSSSVNCSGSRQRILRR